MSKSSMADKQFVHLHLHTDYSLLDGAIQIKKLAAKAAEMNMPAVAMTDHGNMFGAVSFYTEMKKVGVKPIIGCEVYVARGSHSDRGEPDRVIRTRKKCKGRSAFVYDRGGIRHSAPAMDIEVAPRNQRAAAPSALARSNARDERTRTGWWRPIS